MKKLPHKKLAMKIPNIHNLELQKESTWSTKMTHSLAKWKKYTIIKIFLCQEFFKFENQAIFTVY